MKTCKWWLVPMILSIILGAAPLMLAGVSIVYWLASARNEQMLNLSPGSLTTPFLHTMTGGFVILFFVLVAIWIPTGIVMGIRKLRHKEHTVRLTA